MNDEIKKIYEILKKETGTASGMMVVDTLIDAGHKAGSASRDDEVSELVEVIYILDDGLYTIPNISIPDIMSRYTKTPCPECGGKKTIDTCVLSKVCPTCDGRGYKWERKG